WPLWRWRLKWIKGVYWLIPLRPLHVPDLQIWYDGFSPEARQRWYGERLLRELRDLFADERAVVRYIRVRDHLLEGALERCRKR
ncbi:MAG: hypothetical protein R3310_15320, partial [Candidatus Competibacteraceae bacterium]|nr:hypothetical protein [Candidatus Competibacteraceae bacterium]